MSRVVCKMFSGVLSPAHSCIMFLGSSYLEYGLPSRAVSVPKWGLYQDSFLSKPHGASLVVISGSLLYWPIQVASVLGSPLPGACVPRWGSSSLGLGVLSSPGSPSRPAWHQSGGHLRLATCLGHIMPVSMAPSLTVHQGLTVTGLLPP